MSSNFYFPGMIEKGLNEAVTSVPARSTPLLTINDKEDYIEVTYFENNNEIDRNIISDQISSISVHKTDSSESVNLTEQNDNCKNNNEETSVIPESLDSQEINEQIENINELKCNKISRPKSLTTKKLGFVDSEASSKGSSQNSSDTEGDSWVKVNHITPDIGSSATSITSSTGTETKVNDEDKLIHAINELLDSDDKKINNSSLEFQEDSSFAKENQIIHNVIPVINDGISTIVSSLRGSKSSVLTNTPPQNNDFSELRQRSSSNSQIEGNEIEPITNSVNVIDIESDDCGLPLCIFTKVFSFLIINLELKLYYNISYMIKNVIIFYHFLIVK